jgi:hypothetical protein
MRRRGIGAGSPGSLCAFLIAVTFLTGCKSEPRCEPAIAKVELPARILFFYPRDPILPKGEKSVLCYGVAEAKSVRLDPPVEDIKPSLSRCIEIAPKRTTTYTLTAVGQDGRSVTQSASVRIGGPRVKIIEVSVNSLQVRRGEDVTVCYHVKNAATVKVEPGHKMNVASPGHGCYADQPKQDTTYLVTAYDADGVFDSEQVTVKVSQMRDQHRK